MTEKTITGDTSKLMDLVPISRFGDYYDYPSVGALRQLQFNNTCRFTERVIRKIGGRIYIKISALKKWIDDINSGEVA